VKGKRVKTIRAIPVNLHDWLKNFRSSSENYPFQKKIKAGGNNNGEQLSGADTPKVLSIAGKNDNLVLSFPV
jgi:hypothetical protein